MKNLLGKLFGSEKVVGGVVDGIYNGVDKLVYTSEEKADHFERVMKLYEPFKIAQRLLALTFGIPYALAWFITVMASFFVEVAEQIDLLSGDMGAIVLAIIGFYFFGGAAEGGVRAFRETKKTKQE